MADGTRVPIINEQEYVVIDVDGGHVICMDEGGNQLRFDLGQHAGRAAELWKRGEGNVRVKVRSAVGVDQVVDVRTAAEGE
ncbi:hypothetical protein DFJ74DRAFT_660687 [Hyaloraphidium curvatum]|nr:hypothetical protein DFJ74DRAFT_660687 [Hyaloraphidium curvatum]